MTLPYNTVLSCHRRIIRPFQQIIDGNAKIVGNGDQFLISCFPFAIFVLANGILRHI